jgi:iron complex transport system substrate-binding protein
VEVETIAREVVDCAFTIHRDLGPGLLESVYEAVLTKSVEARGFHVVRQKPISFTYNGLTFDEGFKLDLLVQNRLVVEICVSWSCR